MATQVLPLLRVVDLIHHTLAPMKLLLLTPVWEGRLILRQRLLHIHQVLILYFNFKCLAKIGGFAAIVARSGSPVTNTLYTYICYP